MRVKQYEVWIADLNPQIGTESGKMRPVLVLQTNLLNKIDHPSTIICPITTIVQAETSLLRVHLHKGDANVLDACDVMVDQLRAIDNRRLIKKTGRLPEELIEQLNDNVKIVLDLDM